MTEFYFTQQNNIVSVHLKSDELVNAWQGEVDFSGVTPQNVLTQGSVSQFWQKIPIITGKSIQFSGGTPGGLTGDGILFKVAVGGSGKISFSADTAAYLGDGTGRPATSTLKSLNLIPVSTAQIVEDTNPPSPFHPEILRIKGIFNDRPVAVFAAVDKESGISHYEIKEYTAQGILGWHIAESPYLINPGVMRMDIEAVDNFGNVRAETLWIYPPPALWVFLIALIAGLILYNVRKRWRR